MNDNPFATTTPEDLSADETISLFVDVFTDFHQLKENGNVLLKGPRGVGKSMMLRYMEPDCQMLATHKKFNELPYIAVYIPLKNTSFALPELSRFNRHGADLLNEHVMVLFTLIKIFDTIKNNCEFDEVDSGMFYDFYEDVFCDVLGLSYSAEDRNNAVGDTFNKIIKNLNEQNRTVLKYIRQSAFNQRYKPYSGELYDYNTYLVPIVSAMMNIFGPKTGTVFLLFDDAHYLMDIQTRVLNSWIASRTSRKICLKVSTQYNYKTYLTMNGATIDTPHDYLEIDMATIYTERTRYVQSTYYKRIKDIIDRRLELFQIDSTAETFFPIDVEQEKEIEEIRKGYIERFDMGLGKGYNRTDDANRYARPDFIKKLGGTRKSTRTYSYAGFDQLVNISSGIVRYFLLQAYQMYAKELSLQSETTADIKINKISPSIQNDIVRKNADKFLYDELESYENDSNYEEALKGSLHKLGNLIQYLGGLFRKVLISNRSERRIFSVALSDEPSKELKDILELGVQLGYLHKSTIGRKDAGSIGRTRLYVLNRRLAPVWTLDPNGFAGYLFLKSCLLEEALIDPNGTLKKHVYGLEEEEENQLSLFDIFPLELQPDILIGDSNDE